MQGTPTPRDTELLAVIDGLNQAELIDWGGEQDAQVLHARARAAQRQRRWTRLASPLSLRLPLMDPDALLERCRGVADALFSLRSLVLFSLLILAGLVAVVSDWPTIAGYWHARGIAAQAWLLLPLVYLVIKSVHELAHALAVKRWGGEVHAIGISFMLLMPVPYVDASAAWGFSDKRQRMLVGAAGILAEIGIAAVAALVFRCSEAGFVKDLAYTAMLLGSVSTLVFNGNPLLRFDGYYVLADAIEIPNLAPRAARYWRYLVLRYAFDLRAAVSPVTAVGERGWLLCYGAGACLYRILGVCAVAMVVARAIPVLGLLLGLWVLLGQIGWPLARGLHFVLRAPALAAQRRRAVGLTLGVTAGLLLLAGLVRLPRATVAEGVVWLPSRGEVRAGTDGTVAALLAPPNDTPIAAGTPLLQLDNPLLNARLAALNGELAETSARRSAARIADPPHAARLADQLERLDADIAALRQEVHGLLVTSPTAGRLVIPDAHALSGRYVHKGDVVAYVIEQTPPLIRAALPQEDASFLDGPEPEIAVRLIDAPGVIVTGRVRQQIPSATRELPSAALGAMGGGQIAVDPGDARRAMADHFLVDVELPAEAPVSRIGGRAYVRFTQAGEPLLMRLYRSWRRLFLIRLAA